MLDALRDALFSVLTRGCQKAAAIGCPVLAVASVPGRNLDMLSVFARYSPHMDTNLWFGVAKKSMLGLGVALECTGWGRDRFATISTTWHAAVKNAVVVGDASPIALGGFRFDALRPESPLWRGFADGALVIPRLTILQDKDNYCRIVAADYVPPETDVASRIQRLLSPWEDLEHIQGLESVGWEGGITVLERENEKALWKGLVYAALDAISRDGIQKIVAARMTRVKGTAQFQLPQILSRLRADNPQAATFAFGRQGTYFVGATPEILVTAKAGAFQTMALAGSAPRSEDPAQDVRLGQRLLASDKDRSEHDFVVQAILRALKKHCRHVVVSPSPTLYKLRRIQHLITYFSGKIHARSSLLNMIECLHPTPAVGGVPTEPALAFLREYEDIDRGWYAGPVGWLDAKGNGEFMVALRSGVIHRQDAALFAGCGLVTGSDPETEYQETRLKLSTLLDGLCPTWKAKPVDCSR